MYGLPHNQLQLLQRAQNTAARIVTRSKKIHHITPVLQQLHWLPVSYRIDFKIIVTTYKVLNGLAPHYLSSLIKPYSSTRSLRSSTKHLLIIPKWKLSTFGRRSFSVAAPELWNKLPHYIRFAPNVSTFKRRLKSHLFSRAFSV